MRAPRVATHDPGHVALRRGLRAGVAVPLAVWVTCIALDLPAAAAFAAFGTTGLLIMTDYGGSFRRRVASYLASGVIGSVIVAIGWFASTNIALALIATAAIGFAVAFAGVMRGSLALAGPALLIIYMVAVNFGGPARDLPDYLLGWWIAVAISTVAAVALLPRDRRLDVRESLADCLDGAADVVAVGWNHEMSDADRHAAVERFRDAVVALDHEYQGQPFRPSGAAGRDRALTLLVEHVHAAQLLLATTRAGDVEPATGSPAADLALTTSTATALRDSATSLRVGDAAPSARDVDVARARQRSATEQWVERQRRDGATRDSIEAGIRAAHIARMAAILTEQIVELVRQANGQAAEETVTLPVVPTRTTWSIVRTHLGWDSPWFRCAFRSALALTIAIGIVEFFGVTHGVWVLLGVMSVLRFDSASTRRYAWQAIVGTTVGVGVGSLFVWLSGESETLLWIVLPIAVFLAGWGPAAINYLVGQMAFSAYVIVMLSIVDWPPSLDLGLIRVMDVAIGGTVAVVVGLLLWPGGAAQALVGELRLALQASSRYLSTAMTALHRSVPTMDLRSERHTAGVASVRAAETHDIALMQGGAAAPGPRWAQITAAAGLLVLVGDVVARVAADTKSPEPLLANEPELADLVSAATARSAASWSALAGSLDGDGATAPIAPEPAPRLEALPPVNIDANADALVVSLWVIDWLDHLDRLTAG